MRVSSKEFLDIHAYIECTFTMKYVRDLIITYSQMHPRDKYSQLTSIIWSLWRNGWVLFYEQSGCGFESSYSHLIFLDPASFVRGVPWHWSKYRVWIHSEMRTWGDINIQSKVPYREVLTTKINYLVSFTKWLSVRLRTKWFWDRVQLQWPNL